MKGLICSVGSMFRPVIERPIPKKIEKILLFKLGAIGDVCMTTPLIRALRKKYPHATIEYCCGKWSAPVVEANPHLDDVYTFDDKIFFKKNVPKMLSLVRRIRRRNYDVVILLDRSWMINTYARSLGAFTLGFDRGNEGFANNWSVHYHDEKHDVMHYLELGRALGCDIKKTDMEMFFTPAEKKYAEKVWKEKKLSGKVIGIFPGGAKNPGQEVALKRWPLENFVEVTKQLLKKHKVVLFGGPSDHEFAEPFLKLKSKNLVNMIGSGSLRESSALIAKCACFVTNDSGPMHIAAALGVPTVNIFGPTDPVKLAPLGKKHTTLATKLSCQPCYKDGNFADCWHHNCMRWITPDMVVSAVSKTSKK